MAKRPKNDKPVTENAAIAEKSPPRTESPVKGGDQRLKVDWLEARNYYVKSIRKLSMRDIAEHYRVAEGTVKNRAAREKWTDQRAEFLAEEDRALAETLRQQGRRLRLENIELVRRAKRQVARNYMKRLEALAVEVTSMDLDRLVRLESRLMGEADITAQIGPDRESIKSVLEDMIDNGTITTEALRELAGRIG